MADEATADLTASPPRKKRTGTLMNCFGNTVRKSQLMSPDSEKIQSYIMYIAVAYSALRVT